MRTKSKLSTTSELLPNPHPGEILAEEFLNPLKLSQTSLARAIAVPPRRINEIVLGKRAITADTDLRLARYFNMSEGFFIGLQTDYELIERKRAIGDKLAAIRAEGGTASGFKAVEIIFLGAAERASVVHDLGTQLLKWNVLGLKSVLLVNFLPQSLSGLQWVFAIRVHNINVHSKIRIVDQDNSELGKIDIQIGAGNPSQPLREVNKSSHAITVMLTEVGFSLVALSFGQTPVIAQKEGRYRIFHSSNDGNETLVGEFQIAIIGPEPLAPERIAAIRSDPRAIKAAKAVFGCNYCDSKLRFYAALSPSSNIEGEGFTWYANLPDRFQCDCGKTSFELNSIKENFFAVLGHTVVRSDNAIFEPLYHSVTIENLRYELLKILDQNLPEENLQKFIQSNPILLHQFPSERIFSKPPILAKFKADFCIVTPQKELILIEIERADTRLLNKNGDEAAGLRHAIDQINNWLHIVDEHRLAVLDSLGVNRESVSTVRGVVIAGRDRGYDAEFLRRLKGVDRGRVSLLTYDDLAFGLLLLAKKLTDL